MPDAGTKRGPASHELVQQLLNAVFDSSSVGVGVCDRDLRIVVVNNAWAAMDDLADCPPGKFVLRPRAPLNVNHNYLPTTNVT